MSLFEPIEQQTAPTVVYDRLRRSILHGRLVVGSALREAALAREFGVSRSPLREGLHRLEEEGLAPGAARRAPPGSDRRPVQRCATCGTRGSRNRGCSSSPTTASSINQTGCSPHMPTTSTRSSPRTSTPSVPTSPATSRAGHAAPIVGAAGIGSTDRGEQVHDVSVRVEDGGVALAPRRVVGLQGTRMTGVRQPFEHGVDLVG